MMKPVADAKSADRPAETERRRRRHSRYLADFRVTVSHLSGNQFQKIEGRCRDLSEAGIGVLLANELKSGEVAGLLFSLPKSSDPWEVRAVVRHRRGYHYGFEFLSLTEHQRAALRNHFTGMAAID
jgi:hypothetical protein